MITYFRKGRFLVDKNVTFRSNRISIAAFLFLGTKVVWASFVVCTGRSDRSGWGMGVGGHRSLGGALVTFCPFSLLICSILSVTELLGGDWYTGMFFEHTLCPL